MEFIYYILIIGLIFILLLLFYLGFFKNLEFQQAKLGPMKIFYREYIGEYHKVGSTFQAVTRDASKYFKFAKCFGIYYDPPHAVIDKTQTRAIIGVILNNGENPLKEEEFAKSHINYKRGELPLVDAIVTRFPYRNFLTFFMFGKIYMSIRKYMRNRKIGMPGGIMEIYFINSKKSYIEFWIPQGNNSEKYQLSTVQKPLYKEHNE